MNILPFTSWICNAAAALTAAYGAVARQARRAACSRQTVYVHAAKVQWALTAAQQGCPHCDALGRENRALRRRLQQQQQQLAHAILLGPDRQARLAVLLSALGVSIRQILQVLLFLLPTARCPGRSTIGHWLTAAQRRAGGVLAVLDRHTQPLARTLAPDEIFFHGQPTLVAVEPTSLAVLLCTRTPDRQGATWAKALQPFTNLEAVVSDAGTGLAAGLDRIDRQRRCQERPTLERTLDVFHTEKEARTILARIWRAVERAWDKAEAADRRVPANRRGQALTAQAAWRCVARVWAVYESQEAAWKRAKAALGVWCADGTLNDRARAQTEIAAACRVLRAAAWRKVRSLLSDRRALTFLDRLQRQLAEAVPQAGLRSALVELCGLEQAARPTDPAWLVVEAVQRVVCARWSATWVASYQRVRAVLSGVVRASSVVECVNSVLRMHQGRHRRMTQGMLDLKRLYWNSRVIGSGRRRGRCPYQHLGVPLPTYDFWELLCRDPEQLAQELSTQQVAA